MKFYTEIKSCEVVNTEKSCYFKISNEQRGAILAFPSKDRQDTIIEKMLNEEWKNCVAEIISYSYKVKGKNEYKTCFIVVDLLPSYPIA